MKLKNPVTITLLLLSINYLCSWTYRSTPKRPLSPESDSADVPASTQYARLNPLKYIIMGKNYRESWSVNVAMPIFHIGKHRGGYTIEKLGGGMQTKSLHLKDQAGRGWVLRTVDKDVSKALPKALNNAFVRSVVQDQISAAYPYAPLAITPLARALNIPTDTAMLFFVPDDPELGDYRPYFANTVCFLRRKNLTTDQSETYDTEEIRDTLAQQSGLRVLPADVLRARLLDMLIGDWDRHDKQWAWGIKDSAGMAWIYPIPEDRDQAFFVVEGLLPRVTQLVALPHFVGFGQSMRRLTKLNHKAYGFDRFFLASLDRRDWEIILRDVQMRLSDGVIDYSVSRLPVEVRQKDGKSIAQKLKKRRDALLKEGLRYYRFLAREPEVFLKQTADSVQIHQQPGSVLVSVRDSQHQVYYRRTFLSSETKHIVFQNTGSEDHWQFTGQKEEIKIIKKNRPDSAVVAEK